jgi:hypothetical protein
VALATQKKSQSTQMKIGKNQEELHLKSFCIKGMMGDRDRLKDVLLLFI